MSWNKPRLKAGVDLQLQTAFDDGQWPAVIRLAEKRLRTFNDPYFEVVKICAESQLDAPSDKVAALSAVQRFVKDGTVIKDVDGIDLLEWAVTGLQDERDFSKTFGPLKARLVKALPKDRDVGVRCLESCLLHWDLVSAQQIAAILDRTFPQDRTYFFWNVVITYLLSLSSQCPDDKRALYGMLSLKQMQRAAQATPPKGDSESDRCVRKEEEILLYYRILETNGSKDEWAAALDDARIGPVVQFKTGRKDLLLRVLDVCAERRDWEKAYSLCKECLFGTEEAGKPNLLACDWNVWQHFLAAASHLQSSRSDVTEDVASILSAFSSTPLRPIYLRNIQLARVSAAFQLGGTDSRVEELQHYIESQCSSPACFDDIRGFVEQLDAQQVKSLAYDFVHAIAKRQEDPLHVATVKTLAYQLQYLALTLPGHIVAEAAEPPAWKCALSGTTSSLPSCPERFEAVAESSAALYRALASTIKPSEGSEPDCIPELAIVTATSLIRLSGLGDDADTSSHLAPIQSASLNRLLQAALILEHQLDRTPKHTRTTLLLVRLYLVLGCISRANDLWVTMDVKRTIIDSLSPYFLDRLATLSPSAVAPNPTRPEKALTYPLKAYYAHSLRLPMPRRLADAFEAESLTSILEIPSFTERLKTSCTLVMGQLEERRALRALGQKGLALDQEELLDDIMTGVKLVEPIDYGSVPHLDAKGARPIHSILRIGPDPSNARSQLGLLAEQFFEILQHRQPSSLKPANVAQAASVDHTVVLESLQQIGDLTTTFLRSAKGCVTPQEQVYFELIAHLANIVVFASSSHPIPTTALVSQLADAVGASLDILLTIVSSLPADAKEPTPQRIARSAHSLYHVRDAAGATRLTSAYLTAFSDGQKARDRTGASCLPKEVLAAVRSLETAGTRAQNEGKAVVAAWKKDISSGGQLDIRIRDLAFPKGDESLLTKEVRDIGRESWERWAANMADSYRTNVKGWELVRWE